MAEEDDRGEGFLSRWSRRKRLVEVDPPEPEEPAEAGALEPAVEPEPEVVDEELEANRLAAEAIDIDSLGKDDDFTVFLKRGVPELLRRTALRKMWRTDPVFANVDGLNDYDQDFRNPAHSVYKSLWQVGRGFLIQGRTADAICIGQAVAACRMTKRRWSRKKICRERERRRPRCRACGRGRSRGIRTAGRRRHACRSHRGRSGAPWQKRRHSSTDSDDADETEEPRRRVSIRRRLEG